MANNTSLKVTSPLSREQEVDVQDPLEVLNNQSLENQILIQKLTQEMNALHGQKDYYMKELPLQ
eukprot:CAMPEP_0116882182 /NCGR_PEP_ID=MMETSP0463-20121206/14362_1 /TAXON_ID=181622 /ORGANISM="Strombidinopsis sp, Strain SopsisLIS2011" /LENGTH=63 /DNA_ID=CAMNT_0004535007 /DNA_START=1239 /DNA_END=1430 /DNA_ORIENTATION=-